ncbi:hypothetical protein GCM10023328_39660 [Modestobacter marinus]|uniref:Capsular polysaccharide biosynthesis protein n=1 Tax=Modestobacter marinus TaxID=477641 RepID=A0A846LE52_9ACTN|nr:hypothetical protein [Modestobacter marinus]NIH65927.1 capsular polysaccharide biosynthesis protein [Modestobacter marinus]GGL68163.1 hypothetical protein GCM10011589_25660 [Modestobacter marinus]
MQPSELVAALARRWAVLIVMALVGGVAGLLVSAAAPTTYRASTSLFAGMSQVSAASGLGNSSLVARELLPSLAAAGRTAAVLQPVVDELGLAGGPTGLAADVEVTVGEDVAVLTVAATAPTPRQAAAVAGGVVEQLRALADGQYTDAGGRPSLQLVTITPVVEPRTPSGLPSSRAALAGGLLAMAAAALVIGLREAWDPRVRTAGDLAGLTAVPVLAEVDRAAVRLPWTPPAGPDLRAASTERLGWLLTGLPGAAQGARIGLVGAPADLAGPDQTAPHAPRTVPVGLDRLAADRSAVAGIDGLVAVVDVRRATRGGVARLLAAVDASGRPVLGAVLDGVLSPAADRRTRWLAGLCGDAAGSRYGRARPGESAGPARSTRVVALLAVLALGLDQRLPVETDTGLLAAALLLPVWIAPILRHRGTRWLTGLAAVALACGVLLTLANSVEHDFAPRQALATSLSVLGALGAIGLLLWARTVWPLGVVGVTYGVGALVSGVLDVPGSDNAYKFELSFPVTIIVLSLLVGRVRPLLSVLALGVLGLFNIVNDARSAFGFCVIAAGLVLWQARSTREPDRPRPLRTVLLLASALVGAYAAITQLLVSGALGAQVQARSITQIEQTGTLLLGGRPEWTATWALMQENPLGFGLGTVPAAGDIALAKQGFAVTHVPTAEGYIEHYMFAGRFELHSVIADLWSNAGPAGLLWGLLLGGLLVTSLVRQLSRRRASALTCLLVPASLFWLAFGPLPANLPDIAMTLGLVLPLREALPGRRVPPRPAGARPVDRGEAERETAVSVLR